MRLGSFCAFGARHAVPVLELGLFRGFGGCGQGGGRVHWVRFAFFGCWLFAFGGWPGGIGFVSHFLAVGLLGLGLFRILGMGKPARRQRYGGGVEIGFVSHFLAFSRQHLAFSPWS